MRLAVRADDWGDEDALYASIVEHAPERAHGWGWLGMTRLEQGRYAEAILLLAGRLPERVAHHVAACLRDAPDHRGCRAMQDR